MNANSGLACDVTQAATTNQDIVIQYGYSGAKNQQWSIQATQAVSLVWLDATHGGGGSNWDTVTTNWSNTTTATISPFSQNSTVLFDDRGTGTASINLAQALAPANITVNATGNYLWSSPLAGGYLAGPGGLTKANTGTLIIDTTNLLSGPVIINGGTLQIGNGDAWGGLGSGPITNNARLSINRSDTLLKITNGLHGSGSLSVDGPGAVTLAGSNDYFGNTLIQAGSLVLGAGANLSNTPLIALAGGTMLNVAAGGLNLSPSQTLTGDGLVQGNVVGGGVSPGSTIGRLTVAGNLTLTGTTTLEIYPAAGTNDQLLITGLLTYGGTLIITNKGGSLNPGDQFNVFSAGATTGNFTTILGAPGPQLAWSLTNGILSLISTVNLQPVALDQIVAGNQLILAWPADHLGWHLQWQTNTTAAGLGTNWMDIPGTAALSAFTNVLDPLSGPTFYRLTYP